jgi:hypothetical protein
MSYNRVQIHDLEATTEGTTVRADTRNDCCAVQDSMIGLDEDVAEFETHHIPGRIVWLTPAERQTSATVEPAFFGDHHIPGRVNLFGVVASEAEQMICAKNSGNMIWGRVASSC